MDDHQDMASFNRRLESKLRCAPASIMHFLEACAMGNVDRVEQLIEKGVDLNTVGTPTAPDVLASTTGLMMAAMSGQEEVIRYLIGRAELDIDFKGMQGNTALTYAVGQGHIYCAFLLLGSGADPWVVLEGGKSSLGLAADHNNMDQYMEMCNALVKYGCTGTDKDWEILEKHPRKKLFTMMEVLRTHKQRFSLRYLCRTKIIKTVLASGRTLNPRQTYESLEIPRNLIDYLL